MKGIVYRIVSISHPEIQYIGSTKNKIRLRWRQHRNDFLAGKKETSIVPYFTKYGIEDFRIILIKEYDICDRVHLSAYEQLWINKLKCVNINNPLRGYACKFFKKYTDKVYANTHKDEIKAYQKQYCKDNCVKLAAQKKLYADNHKEETKKSTKAWRATDAVQLKHRAMRATPEHKARQAEYNKKRYSSPEYKALLLIKTQCECGIEYITHTKARHIKSENHKYFVINKIPRPPYSERKKTFVKCVICEEQYQIANKGRHYKTH